MRSNSTATPVRILAFLAAPLLVLCCAGPRGSTTLSLQLDQIAQRSTIVVAHRGDSGEKPENTVPAFVSALDCGADMVELDFYQAKDDVLVCFHDKTLDRTTDAVRLWKKENARIADYTSAELTALDAGSWKHAKFAGTRIPTLERALRTIQPGSVTMIEHKAGEAEILVRLLRRLDLVDHVLVQSFDWEFLARARALEPRLTLAALGGTKSTPHPEPEVLHEIAKTHPAMVHWSFKRLRPRDVAALHAAGYLVCVYTINDPADYARAIDMGVDAITTNRPARLRAFLASSTRMKTP